MNEGGRHAGDPAAGSVPLRLQPLRRPHRHRPPRRDSRHLHRRRLREPDHQAGRQTLRDPWRLSQSPDRPDLHRGRRAGRHPRRQDREHRAHSRLGGQRLRPVLRRAHQHQAHAHVARPLARESLALPARRTVGSPTTSGSVSRGDPSWARSAPPPSSRPSPP